MIVMKVLVKKSVVLELTDTEAFAVMAFLNLAIAELKNVPDGYLNRAKDLIDKFADIDV
jgi:hypothetical protein